VSVAADGGRVVFLRAGGLWVYDVSGARERQVARGPGITGYATDAAAGTAVFTIGGRLHRVDLTTGEPTPVPTPGPARDPRLDPTGRRIGYLTGGSLRVVSATGEDLLLAGEPDPAYGGNGHVTWGYPDPTGHHFGRDRGWWWAPPQDRSGSQASPQQLRSGSQASPQQLRSGSHASPDCRSVLAARVDTRGGSTTRPRADVSLHLLELDGGWVDVHWDRETYPYLVSVSWCDHGDPLIAVLRRPQQHGLVLAVDSRTGETQVHAELADPRWVEPVPGTPCHLADGRVLVGGELAHDGYDARCLFADGTLLTPPSLYVRRVVGRSPGSTEIVVEGSAGEPSEQHLFAVSTSVGAAGIDARRITTAPGWHRAAVGGDTFVIGSESLEHPGVRWAIYHGDSHVGDLTSPATKARPRSASRSSSASQSSSASRSRSGAPHGAPQLARVTDRRLPTGVLYPRTHVSGRRLPVLIHTRGLDQGVRAVRADWVARQAWADAGHAVVVVDHRGTPGVAPSFEKVVHRRLADLALADLADALAALVGKHPDLDLDRVAIRGHGHGGWLAALAVLRRPELFRCAIATAPVTDWADAPDDTVFAERYLGLPEDGTEVYQRHSLLAAAAETPAPDPRPLLLVANSATAAPTRQLADALTAAGRPHRMLPASATAEEVRRAERDFLRRHLPPSR
jgi:dipeptidyl-peptidase-4